MRSRILLAGVVVAVSGAMSGSAFAGVLVPDIPNCIGDQTSDEAPVNDTVTGAGPGYVDDLVQETIDEDCETPSGNTQGRNNDQRNND